MPKSKQQTIVCCSSHHPSSFPSGINQVDILGEDTNLKLPQSFFCTNKPRSSRSGDGASTHLGIDTATAMMRGEGTRMSPNNWENDYPPIKLTWQWKIHHQKMYFLLKIGIFRCHVSFQGCNQFSPKNEWMLVATWCCCPPTFPLAAFVNLDKKRIPLSLRRGFPRARNCCQFCNALVGIDDPGFVCFSKNSDLHSN